MTGGSHAEARVKTPPRFGGLALAGIQSGYVVDWATARRRPAPPTSAVAPAPAQPARVRKARRDTSKWLWGRGSMAGIRISFPVRAVEEVPASEWADVLTRHRAKSSEGHSLWPLTHTYVRDNDYTHEVRLHR